MRNRSRHTLTLELEVDTGDGVAGRLSDAQGRGTDFVGWLGLASAIEAFSAPDPPPAHPPPEDAGTVSGTAPHPSR
jgi:hypothetical protein